MGDLVAQERPLARMFPLRRLTGFSRFLGRQTVGESMQFQSLQELQEVSVCTLEQLGLTELDPNLLVGEALKVADARLATLGSSGSNRFELIPPFFEDFSLAVACRQHPAMEKAWRMLLERYSKPLRTAMKRINQTPPEETVAAFFGELWATGPRNRCLFDAYRGLTPLAPWLCLVLRRQVIRASKKIPKQWEHVEKAQALTPSPEESAMQSELMKHVGVLLGEVLNGLGEKDRVVFEERLLLGRKGIKTAQGLGVSPAFVSRRYKEILAEVRTRGVTRLERLGWERGEL